MSPGVDGYTASACLAAASLEPNSFIYTLFFPFPRMSYSQSSETA